ncbi:YggT family protein [Arthrobacter castelli]|uniref:YggT family protein n=1 Tax=Arthrobacter castelli TaxID=271431 RepID=UPI000429DAE2|nr:YggT family protein [Arthrobacter castelli]
MSLVFSLLYLVLLVFLLALLIRLIFDWVQVFAREWKPRGAALVLASGVYSVTDPPLRKLRRVMPPLRLGNISLDLAFLVLVLAVFIAMSVVRSLV